MKYFNLKKIGLGLVAILVILQFIRPTKNEGMALTENDILHFDSVPADVQKILETSCYDCHSNHTTYPWYTNIQPVGLWMQWHVNEGKEELNFSEFNTYKPKRQKHKFEEISEVIEEDEMPLWSYTLIHTETKLSPEQKTLLTNWAKQAFDKMVVPAP
jgi:Haem-binding domain